MTYHITGLDAAPFKPLFDASEAELAAQLAMRLTATNESGYPCRVSLRDAAVGEQLVLVHHVSNDVRKPFRMAHAIYVREGAEQARSVHDRLPAMLDRRTIGLRAFDREGMMFEAILAMPGEGDSAVRQLFNDARCAYIHAHNAAYGCFLAAIERD